MTQTKAVLNHLLDCGSITSYEAFEKYGATRLSAIIYILRRRGYIIETELIKVKTRYEATTMVANYILKGEE